MLAAVKDYRVKSQKVLSKFAFDYLDGGAEDGQALKRNLKVWDDLLFNPKVLRSTAAVDLSIDLFDEKISAPIIVGPTGLNGLYWPKADEILASVSNNQSLPFVLSTASTSLIEDVRYSANGLLWMQLYVQKDRSIAKDIMRRAWQSGYKALVLTVDTVVHGKRDHDIHNGFGLPFKLTPNMVLDFARHPRWCYRMLRQRGSPQLVNLAVSSGLKPNLQAQAAQLSRDMDESLSWQDIDWVRDNWPGKLLIKGIIAKEDALLAVKYGVNGIVISNHGGRQLASAPSPMHCLSEIHNAVGSQIKVLIDGGIRRGSDIAKAIALGADAVLIGRAPLYGLSVSGAKGVNHILEILKEELGITLKLLGVSSIKELDSSVLFNR